MSSRARYPPPGMGGGRGGGGGMNMNTGPNHGFQPRNPTQQYVQRSPAPNNQAFQNPQPQQLLRRTQLPSPAHTVVNEVERAVHSEAIDSSSQDWKAQLKLPPSDTRYRTEGDFQSSVAAAAGPCTKFCHMACLATIEANAGSHETCSSMALLTVATNWMLLIIVCPLALLQKVLLLFSFVVFPLVLLGWSNSVVGAFFEIGYLGLSQHFMIGVQFKGYHSLPEIIS
ncbi:Uncharacterized protein Fot_47797 [Forsythia ovata]|uniref:Uncharacterized protein n=1 Tax=Forsythia ovata TaxID=205694 RepID=A0ABD1QRJ3_9LAMI